MIEELAIRLRAAETTSEILNAIVTIVVPGMQLRGIGFVFLGSDGRPTLGVSSWCSAESLRLYLTDTYERDPLLARALDTGESVAVTDVLEVSEHERVRGPDIPEAPSLDLECLTTHVVVPMSGVGAILGVIQFWPEHVADADARRVMDKVAMLAALRLAELGVTRPVYSPDLARLTPRQIEIARLVIRGDTNADVADTLAITVNTVKKSLKRIFEILGVTTRTELAARLGRSQAHLGTLELPDGYHAVVVDEGPGARDRSAMASFVRPMASHRVRRR